MATHDVRRTSADINKDSNLNVQLNNGGNNMGNQSSTELLGNLSKGGTTNMTESTTTTTQGGNNMSNQSSESILAAPEVTDPRANLSKATKGGTNMTKQSEDRFVGTAEWFNKDNNSKEVGEMTGEEVIEFSNFGNPNGETELVIKFNSEEGWISWKEDEFHPIAPRLVRVHRDYLYAINEIAYSESTVAQTIDLILTTVKSKSKLKDAQTFLEGLIGTVLVTNWESDDHNVDAYNTAAIQPNYMNLVDAQKVLRQNDVVAFHTNKDGHIVLKKERKTKTAWVKGCLEFATQVWGAALPDKTNTKRAYVRDALGVMGLSANGERSMVDADKGGKLFARHSMVKHIGAKVENPQLDCLMSEMANGKLAVHWGTKQKSLFLNAPLLSASNGDGGCIVREAIKAITSKRLKGSLNLDLLFQNEEYKAHVESNCNSVNIVNSKEKGNRKEHIAFVKKELNTHLNSLRGKEIAAGEVVEFQGVPIVTNTNNFPVVLVKRNVSTGRVINTEVRTLKVDLTVEATVIDTDHKYRGQWFKGMGTRNDDFIVEGSDANIIFNDNSVKNRKAVLIRMWAAATKQPIAFCIDGKFRFVKPNKETNNFELGGEVDFDQVQADLESKLIKTYKVSTIVNAKELEDFKNANHENGNSYEGVTEEKLEGDLVRIHFEAEGIEAPMVFAIELSSVAENFCVGRKVSNIQSSFLATFKASNDESEGFLNKTAVGTINKVDAKVARTLRIAQSDKVDATFDLKFGTGVVNHLAKEDALTPMYRRDALAEILVKANRKHNPRDLFIALGQKWPNGFVVSGSTATGGRPWTVNVPTHLISVQGGFDRNGWSYNETVTNTYAFLLLLADRTACPQLIADYAMGVSGALNGWKADVAKEKKAFTKGCTVFETHGMKVLANSTAGYEEHNGQLVPVILVDESNPHILGTAVGKDGKVAKKIKSGDVVFFYRNPMIDLTPAVIRVTKNQSVCGPFTCAVAPSVLNWSSQTDNDGDVLWIIPAKQVGIRNVDTDEEASKVAGNLMKHPLVGQKLANETMKSFGCDDQLADIIKVRPEFSVTKPTHRVVISLAGEAEKVANHYRKRVGQGYGIMHNAYMSFIRKFIKGGSAAFTPVDLQAIKGCSFVMYEEWGLAGYTYQNENSFTGMDNRAKAHEGKAKRVNHNAVIDLFGEALTHTSEEVLDAAGAYAAMQSIQSQVEKGIYYPSTDHARKLYEEALRNGLVRSLTKGAFVFESDNINPLFFFTSKDVPVDSGELFSEALQTWMSFAQYLRVH